MMAWLIVLAVIIGVFCIAGLVLWVFENLPLVGMALLYSPILVPMIWLMHALIADQLSRGGHL